MVWKKRKRWFKNKEKRERKETRKLLAINELYLPCEVKKVYTSCIGAYKRVETGNISKETN